MPVIGTLNLVRPTFTLSDTISPATFNSVTLASATVTISGALAVDGSVAGVGTQTFQNLAVSAALGVTGNTTVGGTLDVAGNTTLTTVTTTGAATLASVSVTGNAAVGGTLSVSGVTSLSTLTAGATTITSLTAYGNVTLNNSLTQTAGSATLRNLTSSGATSLTGDLTVTGVTNANGGLRAGGTNLNAATKLAFKTQLVSVTLANNAQGSYELDLGAGASGMGGAVSDTDGGGLGLRVDRVMPPAANGNTKARVYVTNTSGSSMTSLGVRFSVIGFDAA